MFTTFVDTSERLYEYLIRNVEEMMRQKILSSIAIASPFIIFLITTEFNLSNLFLLISLLVFMIICLVEKKYAKMIIDSKAIIVLSIMKLFFLAVCSIILVKTMIISDSRYFVIYQPKIIIFTTILFALSIFGLTPFLYNLRSTRKNELPIDIKVSIFIPTYYTIFLIGYSFVQKNENFSIVNTIIFGIFSLIAFLSLRKSMYLSRIYFYILSHSPKIILDK